ncbi:hypothetical protein QFZ75_002083 [Streptomyces sp. V3I8]|uniref:hypothetical protein n=1 Tax=Streptomyces sp. V3I8 TaxID=3042279 RepID=UPI0027879B30|nr:hypothetical protein [Streptomyces sp. V3I8]MDQ1035667.1 hypothetical protein [Streptomyces sp. V3I8]
MSVTGAPVVVLDFRGGRDVPVDSAELRRRICERQPDSGRADVGNLRFLVVDEPDGLTAHAEAYELVTATPTLGAVGLLCLVVGCLPHPSSRTASPADSGSPADGAGRRLRLASVLQSSGTGVLWAADPRAGHDARTDDPAGETEAALAALTDLLLVPEVFDEVLSELRDAPVSVAVLSLRVLEHDLSAAVRDNAWSTALTRFAGGEAPVAAPPAARDLPSELAELLGPGPEQFTANLLRPGGPGETARRTCVRALDDLAAARTELGSASALLTGRRTADQVPRTIDRAVDTLRRHREGVAGVLRDSGSPGIPPTDAFARLADAGIELPAPDGRSRVGSTDEGLQRCTAQLLTSGLPLRAVAARLSALAERVAPLPAAARLRDLERACPEESLRRVSAGPPLYFARARTDVLAPTAALGFLSALWPWPGTLLVLVTAAVFHLGGALATAARPGRAAGGRAHRADTARATALLLGTAAAVGLGRLVAVPREVGLAGVLLGVVGSGLCVATWWRRGVADWWDATGSTELGTRLTGIDAVLADALRRQWWAADERTRCADGARTLAAVLRGAAVEAEAGHPASGVPYGHDGARTGQDGWVDPGWDDTPGGDSSWTAPSWESGARDRGRWDGAPGTDTRWEDADWPDEASADEWAATGNFPGPSAPPRPEGTPPADRAGASRPGATGPGTSTGPGRVPRVLDQRADPPWLERGAGDGGPDLVPTLVADLADATVDALRRYTGTAGRAGDGSAGAAGAPTTLEGAVSQAIAAARLHLRDNGVVPTPSFARRDRLRGDPLALLGIGAQRVNEALNTGSRGRPLLLCPPAQLSLLSRDPAEARSITFAPQAVRSVVETPRGGRTHDVAPGPMVWTASGRFAGMLRLIPLRTGVVESVRVRTWADDTTYPGRDHGTAPDPGQERAQR